MKKTRTLAQVATAKKRAVSFLSDVLEDDDRADEVEDESLESYAERKGIQILNNPSRHAKGKPMAATKQPTKADLETVLEQVAEAANTALDPASSRRELVGALQTIADLTGTEDDEDEIDEDDDDDDEE